MNNLITLTFLFISISFNTTQPELKISIDEIKNEKPKAFKEFNVNHEDYIIYFKLEESKNNIHTLVVSMELLNDSYYVSPNAKRDFTGKFLLELGRYRDLDFKDDLIAFPRSVEIYDEHPFVNGTINWVRTNTTYKQQLNIKTKEDFIVYGKVQFTIEPRCTLEQIPFAISFKDGKLTFIEAKC